MIDSTQKAQKQEQKRLPKTRKQAIPGGSIWTHRMDETLVIEEVLFTEDSGRTKYSFNALEKAWGVGAQKMEVKAVLVEDEEIDQEAVEKMRVEAILNMFAQIRKSKTQTEPKAAKEVVLDEEAEFQRSDFDTPECFA